jgi:type I restriction enzyme S subunit
MVPEGWDYSTLESLCDEGSPITYGVLKPGDYFEGGVPLLQIKDLLSNLNEIGSIHRISPELDKEYRRSKIKTNDILISLVGTVGRIGVVPELLDGANIHRNIGRIRTKCHQYIAHYLKSDIAKNRIVLSSSGSSQSALNLSVLRALKVPIPPLPEQQKIARILTTCDKAITNTEKRIDNSKQQKKSLMQQLLSGKKRFPGFEGEWEEVSMGSLTKIYDGTHSTPKYVVDGIPFYSVEHLTKNDFSKTKYISEEVYEKENKRVKLETNDILMTRIGDIGTAKCLTWDVRASFYVSLALIKANIRFNSVFLTYYINSHDFHSELWKRTIHVAFPKKINLGEINNCVVKLPPIEEQQKIASVLTNADKEIELLEQQLADFKQEKKALMQQLLTGKRRVLI